jgi:Coenzyme F420-dependent N5,N10-methylene tetrahydromethanopterin reductase and related flavin-dependent oxidoreductases
MSVQEKTLHLRTGYQTSVVVWWSVILNSVPIGAMTITCVWHKLQKKSGFDYALTQIRFTAGYNAENQHESVSFSHGILAKTEKLKVIAAILPGPWKPALAAKQLATIDHLTNGRIRESMS